MHTFWTARLIVILNINNLSYCKLFSLHVLCISWKHRTIEKLSLGRGLLKICEIWRCAVGEEFLAVRISYAVIKTTNHQLTIQADLPEMCFISSKFSLKTRPNIYTAAARETLLESSNHSLITHETSMAVSCRQAPRGTPGRRKHAHTRCGQQVGNGTQVGAGSWSAWGRF